MVLDVRDNVLWHVYHDSGHVAVVAHRSATAFLGSSVVVELIIFFLLFLSFDMVVMPQNRL
jgi:hypothetical protein